MVLNLKKKKIAALIALLYFSLKLMAVDIIAHRGEKSLAPENSVESANLAWSRGVKFVEGDFYFTKEGEILCVHAKQELLKYAAIDKEIVDIKFSELKKINLAATEIWKDKFEFVAMPTLEDIIKTIPKNGTLVLEIKKYQDGFGKKVDELRRKYSLDKKQITVIAFSATALKNFNKETENVYESYLLFTLKEEDGKIAQSPESMQEKCRDIGASGVSIGNSKILTKDYVDAFKKSGFKVAVWTVNDFDEFMRLEGLGVDAITTDYAGMFLDRYSKNKINPCKK